MLYTSEMPKVVGEFDAVDLHSRIDSIVAEEPHLRGGHLVYELVERLRDDGNPYAGMDEIARIKWNFLFRPRAFGSYSNDGDINDLVYVDAGSREYGADQYHPDSTANRLALPQVLAGASKWPTNFLVGKVAVSWRDYRHSEFHDFDYDFWGSDRGKEAIEDALSKGNAYPHHFEPGEVVKVPPGALHKGDIPAHAKGYRYFMRLFPRFFSMRSGTSLGRMRLF